VFTPEVASFREVPLDKEIKGAGYRHINIKEADMAEYF
jgi:hypothetical protein